jgi:uracil-DNA glycosylase
LLWGAYAQKKGKIVDRNKHLVLEAPHPSPLAGGGFAGNRHFSKTNEYLTQNGFQPIDW